MTFNFAEKNKKQKIFMYICKTEQEQKEFNEQLEASIGVFKEKVGKRPTLIKRHLNCYVNKIRIGQLSERQGREHYFKNLSYSDQIITDYLKYLHNNNLWKFENQQLQWLKL